VRDYAAKVGVNEKTLHMRVWAAEVVLHVQNAWGAPFDGTPRKARTMLLALRDRAVAC
jgi:hypothetical protein